MKHFWISLVIFIVLFTAGFVCAKAPLWAAPLCGVVSGSISTGLMILRDHLLGVED